MPVRVLLSGLKSEVGFCSEAEFNLQIYLNVASIVM